MKSDEKTPQQRFNEAIAYINQLHPGLANELRHALNGQENSTIGEGLSVGASIGLFYQTLNKEKRKALRALLLCHSHYFKKEKAPNGKEISFNHWKTKNITEIKDAILLFTAPSSTASDLTRFAASACTAPNGKLNTYRTLGRSGNKPFNFGLSICYSSIITWLFRSGLVSYQWYASSPQKLLNVSRESLRNLFGKPEVIWDGKESFTAQSRLPNIPNGHIVHFFDANSETLGHWMVSRGNGLGIGTNNMDAEDAVREYSANASLHNQFLVGFNQGNQKGIVHAYNPTNIPDRNMLTAP